MASLRDVLKLFAGLCLAGFFLWSAFRSVDLQTVWQVLLDTDAFWILGSLVLVLLATYPRAYRWRILMTPILPDVPIRKLFMAIIIGYAGNNLIPRAGEVAKIWAIDKNPERMSGLVATVAVERLIDLVALLVMFAVIAFFIRERLEEVFPWMAGLMTTATLFILAVTVFLLALSFLGEKLIDRLESGIKIRWMTRVLDLARSFLRGTEAIRSPKGYAGIAIWSVLLNLAYIGSLYLPFIGFGFHDRYDMGPMDALVVVTVATLGIIIPTPGGTGTYHYFCSRALSGLYGIPLEEAVAFATVVHGLVYIGFLVLGGPGLIALVWNRRDRKS